MSAQNYFGEDRQDPYHFGKRVFFNRWKPHLLHAISVDGASRFSYFARRLPISEKVLSANLRELEEDGLIVRTVVSQTPIRVEYTLTPRGQGVIPILAAIYDWSWQVMGEEGVPIDPVGEMWHGYRDRDEALMNDPGWSERSGK